MFLQFPALHGCRNPASNAWSKHGSPVPKTKKSSGVEDPEAASKISQSIIVDASARPLQHMGLQSGKTEGEIEAEMARLCSCFLLQDTYHLLFSWPSYMNPVTALLVLLCALLFPPAREVRHACAQS